MNSLWMLTISETIASMVSRTRNSVGRTTARGLASSASTTARISEPWVTS